MIVVCRSAEKRFNKLILSHFFEGFIYHFAKNTVAMQKCIATVFFMSYKSVFRVYSDHLLVMAYFPLKPEGVVPYQCSSAR